MWVRFKKEENELSWSRMDLVEIVEVEDMLDVVIKRTCWYDAALLFDVVTSTQLQLMNLLVCCDIAH